MVFQLSFKNKEEIEDFQLLQLHKSYWDFIAKHNLVIKPTIVNMIQEPMYIQNECFLCEYVIRQVIKKHIDDPFFDKCQLCPAIRIRSNKRCLGGLYSSWLTSSEENRSVIANQIANIPINPDITRCNDSQNSI